MEITNYITTDFKAIDSQDSIAAVNDFFAESNFSHFPVLENGIFIGNLSAEDTATFDEDKKVIEGYFAKLNRKAFNYDIMAFILVMMDSSKHYKYLITKVEKMPEILECHAVLGEGSHLLKALVKNTEALEKVLSEIQSWQGVTGTKTTYVLSTVKETFEINV